MANPSLKTISDITERDQGRCALCGGFVSGSRGYDWSVHHRRPRGMGGSRKSDINNHANLILLDGSGTTGCHGRVESLRDAAIELGYLVRLNSVERPEDIPILHKAHGGWVFLTADGGVTIAR